MRLGKEEIFHPRFSLPLVLLYAQCHQRAGDVRCLLLFSLKARHCFLIRWTNRRLLFLLSLPHFRSNRFSLTRCRFCIHFVIVARHLEVVDNAPSPISLLHVRRPRATLTRPTRVKAAAHALGVSSECVSLALENASCPRFSPAILAAAPSFAAVSARASSMPMLSLPRANLLDSS